MRTLYISLCLAFVSVAGCANWSSGVGGNESGESIAVQMGQASLARADLLQRQGQYQQAVIEYRKVIEAADSPEVRQQARLGTARSLISMRKYPAAIATLKPLPLKPATLADRHALAIAGEALLRMRQPQKAESILEIALGDFVGKKMPDAPAWLAGCCGNLGYAYMHNEKPQKAAVLYRQAAKFYSQKGDKIAARRARRMADDLAAVIRQYAPFKPIPLTDDLPAGRS